jgi:hypothetical protein
MSDKSVKAKSLGARYAIVIDESGKTLYIKEPDKILYDAFFDIYDSNPRSAKETALRTLTISEVSDMDIFDDYKALLSAFVQLSEIMAVKKSTLKML